MTQEDEVAMKKIVIAGTSVYGIENMGDEALLSVLCRELNSNVEDLEITWLARHPSEELCRLWDWRNAQGRIKDMAARTLLLKLERRGFIKLPPRQRPSPNGMRNRGVAAVAHARAPICGRLGDLRPVSVDVVPPRSVDVRLFNTLLR